MKEDDFDIPEVFRRAMEEAGWRAGQDDDEGGDRPPRRRPPAAPRPQGSYRLMLIAFVIILLIFSLGSLATFYTDILWFDQLGYRAMFFKRWTTGAVVFIVAFSVLALIVAGNWLVAWRLATSTAAASGRPQGDGRLGRLIVLAAGLATAALLAWIASGQWDQFLLFMNAETFGLLDPIFGRDVSFYIFKLPVYQLVQGLLEMALILTLIGLPAIYAMAYPQEVQRGKWGFLRTTPLKKHAAIVGGFILLMWAAAYFLHMFELLYSTRGVAFGASYTDVRVVLWAFRLQMGLAALTALALFSMAFRSGWRLPVLAGGLWLATAVIAGNIAPSILQRYSVEPNELTLEAPYIENNITFTRFAFGLDRIRSEEFGRVEDLRPEDLLENEDVLSNIRLWDWRPLQQTYRQLQGLRPYYEFNDVDIDRYTIGGRQRQVMLGVRELDKSKLPAPSWVNRNLEFTHGHGIVMNPVNEVTTDGRPRFFIQDFPPRSNVEIKVARPEIYYGELTDDAVYVGSGREEFDYPSGDENVYTHYEGVGGVVLDSFLKRLAFALRQSDPNILLTADITDSTRVQYRRQIQDRIQALTPFLVLDSDPYLVVNDEGRLIWLQDAYTVSDAFPYATPVQMTTSSNANHNGTATPRWTTTRTINYIRNSVKITVDAYNGSVAYYVSDAEDPIIRSYNRMFPGVFRPQDEMPADLRAHIRYPEDLFSVQARQFLTYHMTDVRVFYNKEDLWQIPTEISGDDEVQIEPYFVILPLPDQEKPEFLLILPFSPSTKNNMIGWMAARNDPDVYGELIVYELPKQELVFGPIQVEGRIDQEPDISEQFSLWNQLGSGVIRGNLLVLPINQSFLYIEPIYLRSETSALPELKRIVTADNTSVVMAETLNRSLIALAQRPGILIDSPDPVRPETSTEALPDDGRTIDELVAAANEHLAAAEEAQRAGDWARYGQELDSLKLVLEQLSRLMASGEE